MNIFFVLFKKNVYVEKSITTAQRKNKGKPVLTRINSYAIWEIPSEPVNSQIERLQSDKKWYKTGEGGKKKTSNQR